MPVSQPSLRNPSGLHTFIQYLHIFTYLNQGAGIFLAPGDGDKVLLDFLFFRQQADISGLLWLVNLSG